MKNCLSPIIFSQLDHAELACREIKECHRHTQKCAFSIEAPALRMKFPLKSEWLQFCCLEE